MKKTELFTKAEGRTDRQRRKGTPKLGVGHEGRGWQKGHETVTKLCTKGRPALNFRFYGL